MDVIITNKNPEMTDQAFASIIAEYGSLAGFHEAMREYKARHRRVFDQWPALLANYPDQWIGVAPDETLVVGDSMAEVLALLDQAGAKRGESIVEFLNTKPRRLKL